MFLVAFHRQPAVISKSIFYFAVASTRHTLIGRLVNIRGVHQSNGSSLVMEIIDLLDHLGQLVYYET